jgi:hypothetical protein
MQNPGSNAGVFVLMAQHKLAFVIPGRAPWREPGIHTHDRGYGFRAHRQQARIRAPVASPRNDGEDSSRQLEMPG